MKLLSLFTTIIILLFTNCKNKQNETKLVYADDREYIDHWEIIKTFQTFPDSKLEVDTINNSYETLKGTNQVLIITVARNPIFKLGKSGPDINSTNSLLIELNTMDSIVTNVSSSKSKLYHTHTEISP